jgi:two-component system chemotaxis response regulator CheB
MATHDIITIGASAGGIETLRRLVSMLPGELPAAILVVLHLDPRFNSDMPGLLARAGTLHAQFANDGDEIVPGRIYVAPPDRHLLVSRGRLQIARGPAENRHRPAIDPLFRSAAWSYGPRVVAVVLSGTLDDGAAGLWAVKSCGGVTVVQDPADALYAEMPTSALMTLNVDHCLPLDEIAPMLERLAHEPVDGRHPHPPERVGWEASAVKSDHHTDVEDMNRIGKPSGFTCPACHGGLWELQDGELVHYRCYVGHAFGPESLLAAQSEEVEAALETAVRALEEKGATARRLRDRFRERLPAIATRYEAQLHGLEEKASVIRKLLQRGRGLTDD